MKRVLTVLFLTFLALAADGETRRVPVFTVQFSDIRFTSGTERLKAFADSAAAYFSEQFSPVTFAVDIYPPFTLDKPRAYYGQNGMDKFDENLYLAVIEICNTLDPIVDFSRYDHDGDGTVDDVVFIFAGTGEESGGGEDAIWPQYGNLPYMIPPKDGKHISPYSVCSETSGLGTLCHEYAHSFGLPDWYDTDGEGSGGLARGMWGSTSLMDSGRNNDGGATPPGFNALEFRLCGLGDCEELEEGSFTLEPLGRSRRYLHYGDDKVCYIFECREEAGRDAFIGGSGLLVYHVDRSDRNAGYSDYYKVDLTAYERWERNQVNCRPDNQCAHIVEADPDADDVRKVFFPQDGITRFAPGTELSLTGIRRLDDGAVTFEVIRALEISGTDIFQDAAIISWTLHEGITDVRSYTVEWWHGQDGHKSVTLPSGSRSFTLEGLAPGTAYNVRLTASTDGGGGFSASHAFRTWSVPANTPPYIYLNSAGRNPDGSFVKDAAIPLRVFNATGAAEMRWYFDGRRIDAGADGFFHPDRSGVLKVEILWEKGGSDIIIKKINVR